MIHYFHTKKIKNELLLRKICFIWDQFWHILPRFLANINLMVKYIYHIFEYSWSPTLVQKFRKLEWTDKMIILHPNCNNFRGKRIFLKNWALTLFPAYCQDTMCLISEKTDERFLGSH